MRVIVPKRFSDSNKWDDPFFSDLENIYKLLWIYILDKCNHAGIFKWNKRLADFQLDYKLDVDEIFKVFHSKIVIIKNDKWFIPKFIEFQYTVLQDNNRVHQSVIAILKKEGVYKGYISPLYGDTIQIKDKAKDKETKKEQLKKIKENLGSTQKDFPDVNVRLEFEKWQDWMLSKKKTFDKYNASFRNWLRSEYAPKKENHVWDPD